MQPITGNLPELYVLGEIHRFVQFYVYHFNFQIDMLIFQLLHAYLIHFTIHLLDMSILHILFRFHSPSCINQTTEQSNISTYQHIILKNRV